MRLKLVEVEPFFECFAPGAAELLEVPVSENCRYMEYMSHSLNSLKGGVFGV